ncbi:MAG: hypothetical protein WC254_04065 [Candidatus Woesearchaeota archaeon]|jgi:hypothetical protein
MASFNEFAYDLGKIVIPFSILVIGTVGFSPSYLFFPERIDEYGTLEHPRYLIHHPPFVDNNFSSKLMNGSDPKEIYVLHNYLSNIESCLNILHRQSVNKTNAKKGYALLYASLASRDSPFSFYQLDEAVNDSSQDFLQTSLDTFLGLTTHPFPSTTTFSVIPSVEPELGKHVFFTQSITIHPVDPITDISTSLHELGHLSAQYSESLPYFFRNQTDLFEEAAAYAFTNAGITYLHEKDPSSLAPILMKDYSDSDTLRFASNYYGGFEKRHEQGAALFIATLHVIQDPYQTFNYLATIPSADISKLDPRIIKELDENRSAFKYDISSRPSVLERVKELHTPVRGYLEEFSRYGFETTSVVKQSQLPPGSNRVHDSL